MLQPRHRGRSPPQPEPPEVAAWVTSPGLADAAARWGWALSEPFCFGVLPAGLVPALLRAVGWFDTGHPSRALSLPSLAAHQPCRVMPGSVLPLAGKVSEVLVLAEPVVPRAAPTPCPCRSSAQRGWELLAPGALGCTDLTLLRLDGATRRFSITASLFHLPAQGAQLRGVRLDDGAEVLIPVLMGSWRCLAQVLHSCPELASRSLLVAPGQ